MQKLTHKISTLQIEKKCTKKATNYPSFKNCRKKTVKANKLFKKKLRAEKAAKKAKKSHKN
ncbi:MAG: hypothetical protein HAW58_04370 [Candidatus Thioglobus sp.]|nr:hypothetical protein [Candidatus Thioglobus sp.]